MRSILVHADSDAASEGRLQVALDCARRFEGHVSLLIATPLREFVSFDPFGGTYFAAEALAKAQADDLALESRLADRLAKEDVPWDIEMADGEIVSALSGAATLADPVSYTHLDVYKRQFHPLTIARSAKMPRSRI